MALRLKLIDRDTSMLLPPDLRDWVPENHIVHFIIDAVQGLPLEVYDLNWKGSGSRQYPPSMMLALLIYCYVTDRFTFLTSSMRKKGHIGPFGRLVIIKP